MLKVTFWRLADAQTKYHIQSFSLSSVMHTACGKNTLDAKATWTFEVQHREHERDPLPPLRSMPQTRKQKVKSLCPSLSSPPLRWDLGEASNTVTPMNKRKFFCQQVNGHQWIWFWCRVHHPVMKRRGSQQWCWWQRWDELWWWWWWWWTTREWGSWNRGCRSPCGPRVGIFNGVGCVGVAERVEAGPVADVGSPQAVQMSAVLALVYILLKEHLPNTACYSQYRATQTLTVVEHPQYNVAGPSSPSVNHHCLRCWFTCMLLQKTSLINKPSLPAMLSHLYAAAENLPHQ